MSFTIGLCVIMPDFIEIGRTVAEISRCNGYYRAMLCMRGTSHVPVSVCLCLSQVGVLLKRLNTGSHKQHHTIGQGL